MTDTIEHDHFNCSPQALAPGERVAVCINNPYRRDTGILVELASLPVRCRDGSALYHSRACITPQWWVRFEDPHQEILVYERDMERVNWFGRLLNWVKYL